MPIKVFRGATLVVLVLHGIACADGQEDTQAVEEVQSNQLVSSFNISTLAGGSAWQSEAVGRNLTSVFDLATFNAEDPRPGHESFIDVGGGFVDRVVCPGTSQAGINVFDNGDGWQTPTYISPPSGWSLLWGDPAIARFEGKAWVSSLGSPSTRFAQIANFNGCFRTSNAPGSLFPGSLGSSGLLAGACVFAFLPGSSVASSSQCFRRNQGLDAPSSGNDFLDGGMLVESSELGLFAAYWDFTTNTPAVYRRAPGSSGFVPLPNPPGVTLAWHPIVTATEDAFFLISPQQGTGVLLLSRWNGSWSQPVTIATDFAIDSVRLKDNLRIRTVGIDVAYLRNDNNPAIPLRLAVWYHRLNGALTFLQGLLCDPATLACTKPAGMRSSVSITSGNAFMPAVANALKTISGQPFRSPRNILTYWGEDGASGMVRLMLERFDTNGTMSSFQAKTQYQQPCPWSRRGSASFYWGDYDNMYVRSDFTAAPVMVRPGTDSSNIACDPAQNMDFRGNNQHVSAITFAVP